MNLYCDRYSVCNSMFPERGTTTEAAARAKGWHLWRGTTLGGQDSEVTLCDKCVSSHRRSLSPAPIELDGQYPIPELEIVRPPDA